MECSQITSNSGIEDLIGWGWVGGWVNGWVCREAESQEEKAKWRKMGGKGKGGWEKTRLRKLELFFFAGRLSRKAPRTGKGEEQELKVAWEKKAS